MLPVISLGGGKKKVLNAFNYRGVKINSGSWLAVIHFCNIDVAFICTVILSFTEAQVNSYVNLILMLPPPPLVGCGVSEMSKHV